MEDIWEMKCIYSFVVYYFRTGKPVRCMLDRHEDMVISGGRNPFLCHYSVGFDRNGKIQVLDISLYNNAGSSRDLSAGVYNIHIYYSTVINMLKIVIILILIFLHRLWRDALLT